VRLVDGEARHCGARRELEKAPAEQPFGCDEGEMTAARSDLALGLAHLLGAHAAESDMAVRY
jgi:hypothetical protein